MKRKTEYTIESNEPKKSKCEGPSFGSTFRRKLKTDNAISALQEFVTASKERTVVDEYMNAGGSIKELLDLLKRFDSRNNFVVACTIFSAIYRVLLRVVSDLLLKQDAAEESCKELLSTYVTTIQNILNGCSSSASHKRVILKLLTAMVTLSGSLAKIILSSFSFSVKSLKEFTHPSPTSKSSQKSRKCFINFLLSFLTDGNPVLVTELLQKKGLLTSIIPGLIQDTAETIVLVLNTFRLEIVENMKISKTLKIHTFNTSVLRTISNLYDVRDDTSTQKEAADWRIDSVHGAVHELLLLLCTSSKKGILFRQQNNSNSTNSNQLVFTLLETIDKPWKSRLKCHLIVEILKICPEFMENIFTKWKLDLQPQASDDWNLQIDFIIQILENCKLNSSDSRRVITFTEITSLFPTSVQKLFTRNINEISIHPHPTVRYHLMRLLRTILQNISNTFESCTTPSSCLEEVALFLQKIVIPCNKLLYAWKLGIDIVIEDNVDENDAHSNAPSETEYYLVLLDLLLLYQSLIPICRNDLRTTEVVNFEDYLTVVDSPEFRYKLAQLIFVSYNPKPTESSFDFVMKQFVDYNAKNHDTKLNGVIENVLHTTGFFDGFENEVIIWLHCLKKYGLGNSFVEALRILGQNSKRFFDQLIELNQRFPSDETNDGRGIELDSFDDVETLSSTDDGSLVPTKHSTAVSPVVLAFLHALKMKKYQKDEGKESVRNFTSVILIHLMHLQYSVKALKTLIDENKSAYVRSRVLDFVSFWNHDYSVTSTSFPPCLPEFEERIQILYSCLLEGNPLDLMLEYIKNSEETEAVLVWNACIFYTIRLEQMNLLDTEKRSNVSTILKQLLNKMSCIRATSCLESLLANPYFIDRFTVERTKRNSPLPVILLDVVLYSDFSSDSNKRQYSNCTLPYRHKFISLIMDRHKHEKHLKINREEFTIDKLIKFVALSDRTVISLLQTLIPISESTYMKNYRPSEWSELIACLLNTAAKTMVTPLDDKTVIILITRINDISKNDGDVGKLLEGIIEYIRIFSHHIQYIPRDLVEDICRNGCPLVYKLAAYLVIHHRSFIDLLQQRIISNVNQVEIEELLEVLDLIQSITTIDERIFENIHKFHTNDIIELLDVEDCIWLQKKYRKWTVEIVSRLDRETYIKMCQKLEISIPNLQLDEGKCVVMRIIFQKTEKLLPYVKILIDRLNVLLSSSQDVSWLCDEISENVDCRMNFSELLTLPLWQDFIKLSLKVSLQTDNAQIMRTFNDVCKKVLSEDSTDASALIFQMTISHSAFVNKMLNKSMLKIELIELLLLLTRVNPSVMSSNHIPLLLSAYKASLRKSDQLLLQLLQWYENNDIRFSDCRPYLWGEAAASHFSIQTEISVALTRQPSPNQVLELFDMRIVKNTIKYFPLDRPLWCRDHFHTDSDSIYDLSFMLPLISHLLAPESRISVQKFCRSGALCLVLTALSCEDCNVRMAGYLCLQRFEIHLFSREKEIQIWQQFVNALKNGLMASSSGKENEAAPPRVASLVTTFLANMSLIICEPLNSLYGPTSSFLLAKPSFDIDTIPNFFIMFYSSNLMHRDHQKWILKIIRDGMRYEKDWVVAQKNFLFKFLLQYYDSSLSNASVNVIILQILSNALGIEKCKLFLVTKCGLLSWITHVIRNMTTENRSSLFLLSISKILRSLISAKNSKSVSNLLILLLRKLTSLNMILNQSLLEEFLQLLSNTYSLRMNSRNVLSEKDVRIILELSSPLLNCRTRQLFDNILEYNSSLFLYEFCDNDNIANCIYGILKQFVRNV